MPPPNNKGNFMLPISLLMLTPSSSGLGPIEDFKTTVKSMLFGGLDLGREPLDVVVPAYVAGLTADQVVATVMKGTTRATALLLICLAAAELQVGAPGTADLLLPLHDVLDNAWMVPMTVTYTEDIGYVNFHSLMLSYRGSERQRPSLLQQALKFAAVIEDRKKKDPTNDQSVDDWVNQVVGEYNNQKTVVGVKQWQISEDSRRSIVNLLIGTTDETRGVIKGHLNFHKWKESGGTSQTHITPLPNHTATSTLHDTLP
jgi:hypothetical protein